MSYAPFISLYSPWGQMFLLLGFSAELSAILAPDCRENLRMKLLALCAIAKGAWDNPYAENDLTIIGGMMKRLVMITLMAVLFMATTACAFDGMRKGFVLGGGLGLAPTADWETDLGGIDVGQDGTGLGLNLVIGYAWDEQNMIVYEGNVASWKMDVLDENVAQGFNGASWYGASWYHYFGPVGKSFFTVAGVGFYVFKVDTYEDNDPGFGLLLGGGYEFARHIQVAAYFSSGKTEDSGVEFDHTHFNILVSAVAF
jgi:hypothetical protein